LSDIKKIDWRPEHELNLNLLENAVGHQVRPDNSRNAENVEWCLIDEG
jgi:hypothetical protein